MLCLNVSLMVFVVYHFHINGFCPGALHWFMWTGGAAFKGGQLWTGPDKTQMDINKWGCLRLQSQNPTGGNLSICPGLTSPYDYWVMINLAHGDKAKYERDVSTCTLQKKKVWNQFKWGQWFCMISTTEKSFFTFPMPHKSIIFFNQK